MKAAVKSEQDIVKNSWFLKRRKYVEVKENNAAELFGTGHITHTNHNVVEQPTYTTVAMLTRMFTYDSCNARSEQRKGKTVHYLDILVYAAVEYLQSSDDTDIPAALTYQDNKTPDTGTTAKDCLESLRTCETQRGICRVDLEIFKQFCGDWRNERSLIGCHRQFVKECRSALKTVNHGRPNLRHCTCDGQVSRSIEDLSKCNLLRRNLNSHPCIQEPPLLYREITNFNLNVEHRLKDSAEKRDSATPIEQTSTQESSELFSGANAAPQITTNSSHPGAGSSDEKAELPFIGYSEQITAQEPSKLTADNQPVSQGMEQRLENVNLTFSSVANTTSCLVLLEQCTNQPSCARTLNRYRALCTPRSCNKLRSQCLLAHRAIERYGTHGNCSCDTEDDQVRKRRCLDYEESVILNQCVALATEETADSKSTHDFSSVELPKLIETQVESQQQGISLHNQQYFKAVATSPGWLTSSSNPEGATTNVSNCYDAYRLCIRNRKCLQVYLQLAITCSNAGTYLLSPTSTCSNRLKEFYSQATAYVHRALSCTCSESDHDCQTQLMIFRPQRIGLDQTNYEDSCSALWNNCQENRNCRYALIWFIFQLRITDGRVRSQARDNSYRNKISNSKGQAIVTTRRVTGLSFEASGKPNTSHKHEHHRLLRRENSDASNVHKWNGFNNIMDVEKVCWYTNLISEFPASRYSKIEKKPPGPDLVVLLEILGEYPIEEVVI
ncbi:hypothetical protein CLF_103592 [Clonorchis sinensis]|uniref:Uncharacterized protein n=1 Tax=Clonorchis sinensis TaxID=79923 RepID=H2KQB2_CLOSI|nr:hypothetical protein CLF_103592 [Clonorchis sinensis]